MTSVDIDELGPGVPVARIGLTGLAGRGNVMARLPDGLGIAITAGTPIRVADAVMDRLAVPASPGSAPDSGPGSVPGPVAGVPEQTASELSPLKPRYEPRNMAFAEGLSGWLLDGSFREHPADHWKDYAAAADNGTAVLHAARRIRQASPSSPSSCGPTITGAASSASGRLRRTGARVPPGCSCGSRLPGPDQARATR